VADHFSPILLLLAPLFWISPTSYPLQVAKIIALGTPILPLYWLLRHKHPTLAPLMVLAYALNPLLHQTALEEFHEIMLAAPLLGLAGYAARRENVRLLLLSLGLLLVREDMGVYVALFGLYWLCCSPALKQITSREAREVCKERIPFAGDFSLRRAKNHLQKKKSTMLPFILSEVEGQAIITFAKV